MVHVNVVSLAPLPAEVDAHVVALTGRLLEVVRQTLARRDWGGLRSSHFRLLSFVPAAGTTLTELAGPMFMTKQAVGQFVTQLRGTGHLDVRTDERDRRRRVVVRTELGDTTVAAVGAAIADIERQWADAVGARRYREFRSVLEQLTLGSTDS